MEDGETGASIQTVLSLVDGVCKQEVVNVINQLRLMEETIAMVLQLKHQNVERIIVQKVYYNLTIVIMQIVFYFLLYKFILHLRKVWYM